MHTALCYIPRGTCEPTESLSAPRREVNTAKAMAARVAKAVQSNDADMDSDVDLDEVLADDLDKLAAFPSNEDDPHLRGASNADALYDEEELDDLKIRPSDALILACRADDASTLEMHVVEDFDEEDEEIVKDKGPKACAPNSYIRHDLVLPAAPLCAEYTQMNVEVDGRTATCKFVAVGMYGYTGIDIWDVEQMDSVVPALTLGGPVLDEEDVDEDEVSEEQNRARTKGDKKRKSRRRERMRIREGSHDGPVMCLAWHPSQQHYIASGSADNTVKVWDSQTGYCMTVLTHHKDKVQSIRWHPDDDAILATGSFDKTVAIVNVQTSKVVAFYTADADIESLFWLDSASILVSTESGMLYVLKHSSKGLVSIGEVKAHEGEVSACACSPYIPGMVVTGSTNAEVKVWDFRTRAKPTLVEEWKSSAGAVFSIAIEPLGPNREVGSPFMCAWSGAKGTLVVRDLALSSRKVRTVWDEYLTDRQKKLIAACTTYFQNVGASVPTVTPEAVDVNSESSSSGLSDMD